MSRFSKMLKVSKQNNQKIYLTHFCILSAFKYFNKGLLYWSDFNAQCTKHSEKSLTIFNQKKKTDNIGTVIY